MGELKAGPGHDSTLSLAAAQPVTAPSIAATRPAPQAAGTRPTRTTTRRIGIIGNPRSHAYASLKTAGDADPVSATLAEPATLAALQSALAGFAAHGVDLVVVQGGDGTFRDVLTALPAAFGDAPPELAILATGNTNLAARVFGSIEPSARGLARLAATANAGRLRRATCRTLRVEWPGDSGRAPIRGLFLGAGAYADGKRMADARIHRGGVHHGPAVAVAVVSSVVAALLLPRGVLRSGTPRTLVVDGVATKNGRGLVFLATTLDRLMLGFWPFGSERGGGVAGVRWLDIDAPVRGLVGILLRMLMRRTTSTTRQGERRTGRSDRIALTLDGPFVLDGEMFTPGPNGIVLSDGGAVTIVSV